MASAANSFVRSNEMHAALDRHLPKMAHLTYQGVELPVKWRKLGEGLIAETVEILGRLRVLCLMVGRFRWVAGG